MSCRLRAGRVRFVIDAMKVLRFMCVLPDSSEAALWFVASNWRPQDEINVWLITAAGEVDV